MWPFTKYYSILDSGFLEGATDWHCHILPGVDDGIRTMESALEVLAYYEEIGIREVWLTPHIMEDVPNTPAALRAHFAEFKAAYEATHAGSPNDDSSTAARDGSTPGARGPIRLHLAAENMLDTLFDRRFETRDLLTMVHHPSALEHLTQSIDNQHPETIGSAPSAHPDEAPGAESPVTPGTFPADTIPGPHGDMLLVETSYFSPPMAFEDTLDEIRLKGLHPLLAHPERYVYMGRRDYRRLKENGVRFQLNLMSLVGMYGDDAADKASSLLLEGMYDFAGSDLHRLSPWQRAITDPCLTHKEVAALRALRARMDNPER
jgi:tyrosine-protein phosphatase YwqE